MCCGDAPANKQYLVLQFPRASKWDMEAIEREKS